MVGALGAGVVALAAWGGVTLSEFADLRAAFRGRAAAPAATAAPLPEDPLPVPRLSELALAKARSQFAAGHLAAAQQTLETIGPFDPARPDAERLLVEIQRTLLAAAAPPAAPSNAAARAHAERRAP
jgi:hypothetical protein